MDIYIKPMEKIQIIRKKEVRLFDVAEVFSSGKMQAENIPVFYVPSDKKKTYLLSVIDLIQVLLKKYPDARILNTGEQDILIEYLPEKTEEKKIWVWLKVFFVSLILFVGAATTIMCFHTDVQMPLIFQNIYYLFFEENREMPPVLSIPYSLGLGLGIIIFFNHFSSCTLTEDPTPIEIEMTTYEKEANASIMDSLRKRKGGGER